jgi:diguanylate cyclase (GGDEF)-like protein
VARGARYHQGREAKRPPGQQAMRHLGLQTLLFSRLALKILIILSLCGLLPLFVVGLRSPERPGDRPLDALVTKLAQHKAETAVWLGDRLHDLTRWSSAYALRDTVAILLDPAADTDRARRAVTDDLQSKLEHTRAYESLFIVDRRGNVLATTREERLEGELCQRLIADRDLELGVVSPLSRSDVLERPTLLALYPIRGRHDAPQAFLVGRIALNELEALFSNWESSPPLFFWLMDAKGGVVVSRSARASSARPVQFPLDAGAEDAAREGTFDDSTAVVYRHAPFAAPLGGALAAAIAKADAEAPRQQLKHRVLSMTLISAGVVLVAFLWTTRGVLRPILFLSEGARRLGAGDLNVYLPVWGRDDIAALTAMFNEMIRRLREGREAIEDARDELARTNEDLRAANQTLEALAITDGLTGLYNHRHFQDTLEREIRRCDREGRPLSLLMLDIDHFKLFNDRWGHTEGDAALRRVAGAIMRTIRASDSAFRYGGEELAVLLPGCMKEQAREVAEKMRLAVEDSWSRRGTAVPRLTVSAGVATSPEDARVARALVDAADAALYAAKARGRNCVVMAGAQETGDLLEI